jgi:hypothetical protein
MSLASLKPGKLGDPNATGKPADFAGSMAEAIEDALYELLPQDRKFDRNVNTPEARDRRTILVAVAQGVCGYLAQNTAAIEVKHSTGNDLTAAHGVTIGVAP